MIRDKMTVFAAGMIWLIKDLPIDLLEYCNDTAPCNYLWIISAILFDPLNANYYRFIVTLSRFPLELRFRVVYLNARANVFSFAIPREVLAQNVNIDAELRS